MSEAIDPGLLAAAMERAPVGLIVLAPDGRPLQLNAEARRLLGIAPEEDAPDHVAALAALAARTLDGAPLTRTSLPSSRLLAGEAPGPLRLRTRGGEGTERLLHLEASALRAADGRLVGVVELLRDATPEIDPARAERVVARASELFDAGLEPDALLARLGAHCASELGELCVVVRLRPDGAPGPVFLHHVDPARRALAEQLCGRVAAGATDARGLWGVARVGEPHFLSTGPEALARRGALEAEAAHELEALGVEALIAEPLRARGRRLGAIAFGHTIPGERPRALDRPLAAALGQRLALAFDAADSLSEARAAVAARDEFLAVASHDLRNPLGVVALNAELLEQSGPVGERSARLVAGIRRAAAQMTRLVSDLLDVAALDAGQLRLERADLDAGALVHELVEQLRDRAANAGIVLLARVGPTPLLQADRGRLLQILGNLVENALRVAPSGSAVEISSRGAGGGIELEISDRGPGLAAGEEGRLFLRFERGAKGGRAGLGLTIARGLVEAHGGTLTWEPRAGGGSTFRIRLGG